MYLRVCVDNINNIMVHICKYIFICVFYNIRVQYYAHALRGSRDENQRIQVGFFPRSTTSSYSKYIQRSIYYLGK